MSRRLSLITALLLLAWAAMGQDGKSHLYGWEFMEVNHSFTKSKLYLNAYLEYDLLEFREKDCFYGRFSFGVNPLKWLRAGINYVPLNEAGRWYHYGECDITFTLKSGDFKVSVRERYRHGFTDDSNELRSRLKVIYSVPKTKFAPYLSIEVFTWGAEWKKTRHYVGCTYRLTDWMALDWYYMYYVYKSKNPNHIIGLGLNFDI